MRQLDLFSILEKSDRGHLVCRDLLDDDCVGEKTHLEVALEVNDPLFGCDVELCVNALSAHAVCHVELVVTISYRDPDLLGIAEVTHGDLVEVDTETYCAAHGVAHTVDLDDTVLRERYVNAALLAGTITRKIYDCLACGTFNSE